MNDYPLTIASDDAEKEVLAWLVAKSGSEFGYNVFRAILVDARRDLGSNDIAVEIDGMRIGYLDSQIAAQIRMWVSVEQFGLIRCEVLIEEGLEVGYEAFLSPLHLSLFEAAENLFEVGSHKTASIYRSQLNWMHIAVGCVLLLMCLGVTLSWHQSDMREFDATFVSRSPRNSPAPDIVALDRSNSECCSSFTEPFPTNDTASHSGQPTDTSFPDSSSINEAFSTATESASVPVGRSDQTVGATASRLPETDEHFRRPTDASPSHPVEDFVQVPLPRPRIRVQYPTPGLKDSVQRFPSTHKRAKKWRPKSREEVLTNDFATRSPEGW